MTAAVEPARRPAPAGAASWRGSPAAVYGSALRQAASGRPAPVDLVGTDGRTLRQADARVWSEGLRAGDAGMLARCAGATLDAGCGPGRLAAALRAAGLPALGVDVSAEAVRQARRRGAVAVRGNVFGPLPDEGGWRHLLLADGNIGIGGDPLRLLVRCRALLAGDGDALVEVDPPGAPSWQAEVAVRAAGGLSTPFGWAAVGVDDLSRLAERAALRLVETWTEAGRWFGRLSAG
jgi:SAM-dependent methyltransferase